jgi:ethanolamine-phosphate cytidylyltransferase
VIIGAPYSVTEDILNKEYTVHIVAHSNTVTEPDLDGKDPYEVNPTRNSIGNIYSSVPLIF